MKRRGEHEVRREKEIVIPPLQRVNSGPIWN
jgi:hypothetical protein